MKMNEKQKTPQEMQEYIEKRREQLAVWAKRFDLDVLPVIDSRSLECSLKIEGAKILLCDLERFLRGEASAEKDIF